MLQTQIAPDKIRAYKASSYRLEHCSPSIALRIDQYHPALAELLSQRGVSCGAFITAHNPRGAQQSDQANDAAHGQLARQLAALGVSCIEGSGSEKGTPWPAERSYFALGLSLQAARNMGAFFNQDAIVWVGADAIPQLILLR